MAVSHLVAAQLIFYLVIPGLCGSVLFAGATTHPESALICLEWIKIAFVVSTCPVLEVWTQNTQVVWTISGEV
jgi:hypothetical protein